MNQIDIASLFFDVEKAIKYSGSGGSIRVGRPSPAHDRNFFIMRFPYEDEVWFDTLEECQAYFEGWMAGKTIPKSFQDKYKDCHKWWRMEDTFDPEWDTFDPEKNNP